MDMTSGSSMHSYASPAALPHHLPQGDVMVATSPAAAAGAAPRLSPLTLALLEDTGWYAASWQYAMPLEWAKGAGCDFAARAPARQAEQKLFCPTHGERKCPAVGMLWQCAHTCWRRLHVQSDVPRVMHTNPPHMAYSWNLCFPHQTCTRLASPSTGDTPPLPLTDPSPHYHRHGVVPPTPARCTPRRLAVHS